MNTVLIVAALAIGQAEPAEEYRPQPVPGREFVDRLERLEERADQADKIAAWLGGEGLLQRIDERIEKRRARRAPFRVEVDGTGLLLEAGIVAGVAGLVLLGAGLLVRRMRR
jgi:hypothetical protein